MIALNTQDSAVSMNSITIRDLSGSSEFQQMERVQTLAWDRDPRSLVPWEFMKIAQYSGAVVLGAFDGDKLIGYAFGVLGTVPTHGRMISLPTLERLQVYSHQLAVLPEYQSAGVGRRLKLAQREFCRRHNIELMTWTFDPLMGRNGWLNIGRLGGRVSVFLPNWYGDLQHRFILEWWLNDDHVQKRLDRAQPPPLQTYLDEGIPIANPTSFNQDGSLTPPARFEVQSAPTVLLEVPGNISAMRRSDPQTENAWRHHIQEILPAYLDQGYLISEVCRSGKQNGRRIFYVLNK